VVPFRSVDAMWSLGARYCARQDMHAFFWLWALLLAFAGAGLIARRLGGRFAGIVLLFFAVCTGALGLTIFYGCYASAPYTMGLGAPTISAARLTTLTCLGRGASAWVFIWTVFSVSCSAALVLIAWGGSRDKSATRRAAAFIGAALLLALAGLATFVAIFDFSWCSSSRLF
jgi:hypothetical protein